jgi:hypothetical protein
MLQVVTPAWSENQAVPDFTCYDFSTALASV